MLSMSGCVLDWCRELITTKLNWWLQDWLIWHDPSLDWDDWFNLILTWPDLIWLIVLSVDPLCRVCILRVGSVIEIISGDVVRPSGVHFSILMHTYSLLSDVTLFISLYFTLPFQKKKTKKKDKKERHKDETSTNRHLQKIRWRVILSNLTPLAKSIKH